MATSIPSLVIRRHDPAQRRRMWLQLALAWLGSLLIAGVLVAFVVARVPQHEAAAKLAVAEKEGDALKTRVVVLERSAQVAKAALVDVQQTLRERQEEIAGLRADLAFYGRLVGGSKREGLAIHALHLKPIKDSLAWNVVATLTQNFQRGQDIKGRLMMSVEGVQGDKLTTLDWSALAQGQDKSGIEYSFKYFQQVSGTIMLPEEFTANRVIVRADGEGGRVEQEFSWKDAIKGEENDDVRQ